MNSINATCYVKMQNSLAINKVTLQWSCLSPALSWRELQQSFVLHPPNTTPHYTKGAEFPAAAASIQIPNSSIEPHVYLKQKCETEQARN